MKKLQKICFAQKAVVLRELEGSIYLLVVKYSRNPLKNSSKIEGKYGFPGGKLHFGEELDHSLKRECLEETGVDIKPGDIIGFSSCVVEKENAICQYIAVHRLSKYVGGNLNKMREDGESMLTDIQWVDINRFDLKKFLIENEFKTIEKIRKLMNIKSGGLH